VSQPGNPTSTFGVLIARETSQGTEYVKATLVRREPGKEHPCGASDGLYVYSRPKHLAELALDGLGMYGFVNEPGDAYDATYIGHEAEFRDVYAIDETLARKIGRTLARVNKRIDADKAYEPGDKLAAICAALRLDFVVERVGPAVSGGWAEMQWRFMTVPEGRNRFRQLIAQAVEQVRQKRKAA
jgi:hypothetical protein